MPQKKWVTITKYNASAIQLRIQNKHKTPSLWCDFHIKWAEDVILDDDDNSDANDDGDNGDNDNYDDDDDYLYIIGAVCLCVTKVIISVFKGFDRLSCL